MPVKSRSIIAESGLVDSIGCYSGERFGECFGGRTSILVKNQL